VIAELSVEENLRLGGLWRRDVGALSEVYERFGALRERRAQPASTLSGGERQMLVLGRALMARPRLLLLDEPSLGLAPVIVQAVFRIISEIRRRGTTVLLVEQNARMGLSVADYGYVLESGRLVLGGKPDELWGNEAIRAAYLGGGQAAAARV
jgi:branched-chain amino acid transport system ATP-binding protein